MRTKIRMLVAAALAAGIAVAALAQPAAEKYPRQPIRMVVTFPPGGSSDAVVRMLLPRLNESLGQPVIVDNRPGGNTVIGAQQVAKAAPDGYTLLMMSNTLTTNETLLTNKPYALMRDLTAVAPVNSSDLVMAVSPSVPAKTVQELIAYAKANSGKLSFAHSGTGSGQHMSGELLKKMAGVDIVHVPYKGGGPAVQDLVAGQVPLGVLGSTPLIPHHKSGRIRIIAFTSKERFAPMPEIPTLHESGLVGFDTTQWLGILAPKGTPGDVIERIYQETKIVLGMPDVKQRLAQAALQAVGGTPKEFDALIRADLERWTAIASELKLEPQ